LLLRSEVREGISFCETGDYCGTDWGLLGCDTIYDDKQASINKTNYVTSHKRVTQNITLLSKITDLLCSLT